MTSLLNPNIRRTGRRTSSLSIICYSCPTKMCLVRAICGQFVLRAFRSNPCFTKWRKFMPKVVNNISKCHLLGPTAYNWHAQRLDMPTIMHTFTAQTEPTNRFESWGRGTCTHTHGLQMGSGGCPYVRVHLRGPMGQGRGT